jgi:hypothetical protein
MQKILKSSEARLRLNKIRLERPCLIYTNFVIRRRIQCLLPRVFNAVSILHLFLAHHQIPTRILPTHSFPSQFLRATENMAEYEKMTVANLRVLLKDRGIPGTGLTRKAQIVAKLQEVDAAAAVTQPVEEEVVAESEPEAAPVAVVSPPASAPDQAATVPEAPDATETSETEEPQPVEEAKMETETPAAPEPPVQQQSIQNGSSVAPEPESPALVEEKANRSLSQTPLPSKEDPTPQPLPQRSVEATPMMSREDTAATTQTDTDERKKRKRRSGSPPVDTQEVAIKKARVAEAVHLTEDKTSNLSQTTQQDVTMSEAPPIKPETRREEAGRDHGVEGRDMVPSQTRDEVPEKQATTSTELDVDQKSSTKPQIRPSKDIRYQKLRPTEAQSVEAAEPISIMDLPTPAASIHEATRALYIKGFMRPLQLLSLRAHIVSLTGTTDDEIIETLYIDPMRTHAFVVLNNISAAGRVRAGLHDQIWPRERDRKPLWADYVPEHLVSKWIESEENAGSGTRVGGRKWEVVYESADDGMQARHMEVGTSASQTQTTSRPTPTGPSQPGRQASVSKAPAAPKPIQPEQAAKSFIALDKLFKSTQAKPMLYFQPVSTKIVDERLDELDYATGKRWSSRDWKDEEEHRRYTFEDEKLVDTGIHNPRGRGGFESGRGGPSSRYGRGPPRGVPRGNWRR